MDKQNFDQLLERFLKGTASEAERDLVNEYFQRLQADKPQELQQMLNDEQKD